VRVALIAHLGTEASNLFKELPGEGAQFPYLASVRAGDPATESKQRYYRNPPSSQSPQPPRLDIEIRSGSKDSSASTQGRRLNRVKGELKISF